MEASRRKIASTLSIVAGSLAGAAAAIEWWRSGSINLMPFIIAGVFVLAGLGIRSSRA